MANLNKVFLMGNLTRDPELRYTPSGTAVASFGIAINREWKSQDGEQKKETCFVDASIFGKRAEVVSEYFNKGKPIFIEGRLQFHQWETKDGQKRNTLRVIVEDFQFIGGKAAPSTGHAGSRDNASYAKNHPEALEDDVSNDEIPF